MPKHDATKVSIATLQMYVLNAKNAVQNIKTNKGIDKSGKTWSTFADAIKVDPFTVLESNLNQIKVLIADKSPDETALKSALKSYNDNAKSATITKITSAIKTYKDAKDAKKEESEPGAAKITKQKGELIEALENGIKNVQNNLFK